MSVQRKIPVSEIDADPDQPRKRFNEGDLIALGENIRAIGLQVLIIVYLWANRYRIADGERRWRAAQLVGITELDAIVLPQKPSAVELRRLQLSLEVHKAAWSAVEQMECLFRIKEETGWGVSELAANLSMKQPQVSRLLGYKRLCPEVLGMLHAGDIDRDKAFTISQEPDALRQIELAKSAKVLTREQLRRKTRGKAVPDEPKTSAARFTMPGGMHVAVLGRDLTLAGVIEVLSETVRVGSVSTLADDASRA